MRAVRRSPSVTSGPDEPAPPPPAGGGPQLGQPGADRPTAAQPAGREAVLAAASPDERLRRTAFAELDRRPRSTPPAGWPAGSRWRPRRGGPAGPAARRAPATGSTCAAASAARSAPPATRSGWSAAAGATRPRRLVLLCDVSASMEPYTRVFLTLLHGAVVDARAEAFVFATRLTRLTRALRGRDPDAALARAAATAPDWAGGTRLGGEPAPVRHRARPARDGPRRGRA